MNDVKLETKLETKPQIMKDISQTNFPYHCLQLFIHALFPMLSLVGTALFGMLLINKGTSYLMMSYMIYIIVDQSYDNGGRSWAWVRDLSVWEWYVSYFPTQLVMTTQLDPEKKYILAYHPHGILALGAFSNFMTNATGCSKLLKGMNVRMATVNLNFWFPFNRDLYLALGFVGNSKKAIQNSLKNKGDVCILAVGGASESLYAKPGSLDLILAKRYGFIKMALKTGSHLVPVFNYGENYLTDQLDITPGSTFDRFRTKVKGLLGISLPAYIGRGLTEGSKGYLPKNVSMPVIVGDPIPVEKDENPSDEKIQELHKRYMNELKSHYIKNAPLYHPHHYGPPPEMNFI